MKTAQRLIDHGVASPGAAADPNARDRVCQFNGSGP